MRPSSAYTGFGTVLTLVVVVLASFEVSLHGVAAQCGADGDLDSDNVCNNVDSCAFDPGNDMDSDSLCALVCEFTTAGVTTDVTTTSSSATITTTDTTTTARITTTSTDRPTPSTTTSAGRTATTSTDRITDRTTSGDVRDTTSTTRAVTRKTTSATRGGGRTTDRSTTTTIIRRDTTSATRIDRSTTVTDRVTRPPVTSTTVPQRSTTSGTGRISTRSTTTTRPVRSTSSTELPTRRPTTGAGGAETTPSRQLATTRGAGTTAGFYARFNGRTSCADNGYCIIDSVAECETAGAATSTDGSAPVASEVDSALKPAGCFINTAGALRFNTLLDSTAEGSTTNEVVCMMCVVGTTPRGGNGVASTPRGGFPAVTTPRGGVPAVTTPRGGIPAVTTPRGGVVADTTPRGGVVADTTPRGGVVADTTPRGGVVADTTPRGGVVVDTTRRGDVRTTSSARGRTTARSTTTTDGRQTRTTTDERGGRTTAGRGDPTTTSVRGGRTTTTSTRRGRPTSATSTRGAPTTSTTGRGRPILTTRPVRAASRLLADTFKINGFTCMEPDLCPGDALNDIDSDGVCGDEDSCPFDPNNDADGDGGCDDACLSNSCFEQSCDEWIYSHGLSCELLEDTFGCSCYGCSCKPMECSGACKVKAWFGDNVCDDVNNNCGCGWDGGDCCGPVNMEIGGKNDFTYCDDCRCLDPSSELDAKDCPGTKTCDVFGYMADFFCDDGVRSFFTLQCLTGRKSILHLWVGVLSMNGRFASCFRAVSLPRAVIKTFNSILLECARTITVDVLGMVEIVAGLRWTPRTAQNARAVTLLVPPQTLM